MHDIEFCTHNNTTKRLVNKYYINFLPVKLSLPELAQLKKEKKMLSVIHLLAVL